MNKLSLLFEKSSDAAFGVDVNQHILFWNPTAASLTGYSAAAVIGRPCWQLLQGISTGGTPFCRANCPILRQVRAGKLVQDIDIAIRVQTGLYMLVNFSTISVLPEHWNGDKPFLVHLIRPVSRAGDPLRPFSLYLTRALNGQRP